MASLLSFSLRQTQRQRTNEHHASSPRRQAHGHQTQHPRQNLHPRQHLHQSFVTARQSQTDPWALGIATSTSSGGDSLGMFPHRTISSDGDIRSTTTQRIPPSPPTPEGLRPRKSIQRIRQDVHDLMARSSKRMAVEVWNRDGPTEATPGTISGRSAVSPSPSPCYSSSISLQRSDQMMALTSENVPSSLACRDRPTPSTMAVESYNGERMAVPQVAPFACRSPPISTSSFYNNQSMEYDDDNIDEDADIDSDPRRVAISPDLHGGHARTAVGAAVLAMTGSSSAAVAAVKGTTDPSKHSILPPRTWMRNDDLQQQYEVADYEEQEDETLNDDYENESSIRGSPSSNPWKRRQSQFQSDTSFTRDLNTSWVRENSGGNRPRYDFEPIWVDPDAQNSLNISAISHSQHNMRDADSFHSIADTMNDDEDEAGVEIPRFYQALTEEDAMVQDEETNDKALILAKSQNQRRIKETLLLSALERLQDEPALLMEVTQQNEESPSSDFKKTSSYEYIYANRDALYRKAESILLRGDDTSIQAPDLPDEMSALALRFYLSLLQLSQHAKQSPDNGMIHCWKSVPGFRTTIGLDEDPQSPPTIRGGGTSLFSLPSESANDQTPHTSNVSIATTITTVLSPDRNSRHKYRQAMNGCYGVEGVGGVGLQQTVEMISRLLLRLKHASQQLLQKDGKKETLQELRFIYLEFLQISVGDLKHVIDSFELIPVHEPSSHSKLSVATTPSMTKRLDSKDRKEAAAPISSNMMSPPLLEPQNDGFPSAEDGSVPTDNAALRVNVMQDDQQNCEVEVWTPTTDDMNTEHDRHIHFNSNNSGGYEPLVDEMDENEADEGPVDDLRRTVGSFDQESVQEERDPAPAQEEGDNDGREGFGEVLDYLGDAEQPTGAFVTLRRPIRRMGNARRGRGPWRRRFFPRLGGGRDRRQAAAE